MHECIYCKSDPPLLRLSRHHYEVIIIGTWYEFAHQSSPLSQHTLCGYIVNTITKALAATDDVDRKQALSKLVRFTETWKQVTA